MQEGDGVAVLEAAKRLEPAPAVMVLTKSRTRITARGATPRVLFRGMTEQGVAHHG